MRISRVLAALAVSVGLVLAACGGIGGGGTAATVRLQLQWLDQAQFAGYYAAQQQGYYEDENLTVDILPGGPDVVPQQIGSASDGPEFTIAWVPKVLEARQSGSDLVQIAQMFQRSATLSVAWADAGITEVEQWAGKKIGAWPFGNELEVLVSAQILAGLTPDDFTRVEQDFDMNELIAAQDGCGEGDTDCVDVAEAMIYNEWAQLLEATDPNTGELFQPEQFYVFNYNDLGTAMLQDALWARQSWLDEEGNEDVATRFLRASFKGWIYCRDNPDDCVQYSVDRGSVWPQGHLRWMMNEINKLVWPAPDGIGVLNVDSWNQTVQTATEGGVLTEAPADGAYRTDLTEAALDGLDNATGTDWTAPTVEVTPGGE